MRPVPLAFAVVVIVALGYLIQDRYLQRSDQASGEPRLVQAEAAGSSSPKQFRRQRVSRVSASSEWKLPFRLSDRISQVQQSQLSQDPELAISQWPEDRYDLIVAWAGIDPDAAMAWVDRHIDEGAVDLLSAMAAGHLLHGGPEAMEAFIEQHNHDPRLWLKHQGALQTRAWAYMAKSDTIAEALEMVKESKNASWAGSLVTGADGTQRKMALIDYMEAKQIKVEIDYWSLQRDAEKEPRMWADWAVNRNSELLSEVVQSWARQDREAALQWTRRSLVDGDARKKEILDLIQE